MHLLAFDPLADPEVWSRASPCYIVTITRYSTLKSHLLTSQTSDQSFLDRCVNTSHALTFAGVVCCGKTHGAYAPYSALSSTRQPRGS